MPTRIQFDALGIPTVSDPEKAAPVAQPSQESTTPAPSLHKTGNVRTRYTASEDGPGTFEVLSQPSSSSSSSSTPTAPASVVSVMSPSGGRLPNLSMASMDSIVDLGPGLGDSSVAAWMQLGLIEPNANGAGFRLVNGSAAQKAGDAVEGPKAEQVKNQNPDEVVTEADLKGVRGTSQETDSLISTLDANAPGSLDAAIEMIARGEAPDFAEAARLLQDEGLEARGAAMHQDLLKSGQDVLRAQGIAEEHFAAFETWAIGAEPARVQDAIRSFVMDKQVNGLVSLARQFRRTLNTPVGKAKAEEATAASYTADQVLAANFGNGIRAFKSGNGQAVLDIPGRGKVEFNEAVRLGYIRVSGRP